MTIFVSISVTTTPPNRNFWSKTKRLPAFYILDILTAIIMKYENIYTE